MARGFDWAVYVDDTGARWALQVDSDYVLDGDRGWALVGVEELPPFPRGWRARRVVGLDSAGATIYAIAASTAAAIWLMSVVTFSFEANDGTIQTAAIIARQQERRTPRPGAS